MTSPLKSIRNSLRQSKLGHAHRFLRYKHRTEPESIRFVQSLDLKGRSVLDVGANRGVYCYYLSKCVGPDGSVTAFDPQPECVETIHRVTKMFGLRNLEVRNCGLSDRSTTVTVHRGKPEHGSASVNFVPSEHRPGQEIEASVVTLDSIMDSIPRPISFIKCDIEGHELAMFTGARQLLAEDKPIILVEIQDDEMSDVNGLLASYGYQGSFHVGRNEHPIEEYARRPYVKGRSRRNYIFRAS